MEIIRELDKKSLLHFYTIYTKISWSVLAINNPTLIFIYYTYFYHTSPSCLL